MPKHYAKAARKLGKAAGKLTSKGMGKVGGKLLAKRNKMKSKSMRKSK